MVSLLIVDPRPATNATDETVFGGLPSTRSGEVLWPSCRTCRSKMQFLGQIRTSPTTSDRLLLLFMCQAQPGLCDEWDANAGGNAVIVSEIDDLTLLAAPEGSDLVRQTRYGASSVSIEAESYDDARNGWASNSDQGMRQILGQIGGQPSWIQGDETPLCDRCKESMTFVAQLEQGPDHRTAMNFGGGCAYVFECQRCDASAKLLWQS
jgi:hypothetical protein